LTTPQVNLAMLCKRCQVPLLPGKAMESTVRGIPDFPGGRCVVTLSPGGPGRLVECLKCPHCGWSVSPTPTGEKP